MKLFKAPIISRKEIAEHTVEVTFAVPAHDFEFQAGQYVRITIPELTIPDPRGNYRDFSIVSSPNERAAFTIAVRASESGFKKTLLELPLGSEVQVTGPHGEFTLPKNPDRPIVYIAGGIGITPFMSHFQFAFEEQLAYKFIVLYSNTALANTPYLAELDNFAKQHHDFTVEKIFAPIEEKHIRERIMGVMEITTPLWFLAGPPAMISLVRKILLALGVSEGTIHIEEFLGYESGSSIPSQAIARRVQNREEVLKLQVARAETLLDALSKIALISEDDLEGTITFANDKFVEIAKYKREEIMGQNHRILKSGYHPPEFFKEMWATISSGRVWHGEVKNMAKDGTYYWVDSVIAPVTGDEGRPVSYLSVRFPITERKELEEVKAKDEAVLASIGDGLAATDEEGKIVLVSKSFTKLLGWEPAEVKGRLFTDVVQAVDENGSAIPESERLIYKIFRQHTKLMIADAPSVTTDGMNIYYKRKDGTRFPVGITVSPILIGNRFAGAVEVFRDVTKEKGIDQAKTEFVSLASHQLRTPLTTVNWYSEMLLRTEIGKSIEKQKEYLEKIHSGSQRMVGLVNTLLNVSRIELGTLSVESQPVDVAQFIQEVIKEQDQQIDEKKITITTNIAKDMPVIETDPTLLRMIFQNLLSNAVKYTAAGGRVGIAVSVDKATVLVAFSDTGYGIPKKDQDKVFTKMFRADNVKEKGEGTGLGLYIVKSVLSALGGSIQFTSEEQKGTTFYLTFPLTH
ncbi:MAG TPA: PAS domain-containing protein [Candidatus Paceibacterota bacterium]|nr:PAS domain-containing protein [Candidatus Paceibacterota bacterium]